MVHVFLFQVGLVLGQARIHQAATFRGVIATLAKRLVRVMTLTAHVVFFFSKDAHRFWVSRCFAPSFSFLWWKTSGVRVRASSLVFGALPIWAALGDRG